MRQLASELGISAATVSLALRDDPRITPAVTARVKALAAERGYHADPIMAEGLSRARRHDFYRETVAWLLDHPVHEQPWMEKLFSSVAERGRMLGYQIEHFPVDFKNERALRGLMRTCSARGIRGMLLGPFAHMLTDPDLPWDEFSWVTIGQSLVSPAVDRVGRDYDKDIGFAVSRLIAQGCRRPGFIDDGSTDHLMGLPLLRASLVHYHKNKVTMPEPFFTATLARPADFRRWLTANQPDSIVLGMSFGERAKTFRQMIAHLPQVELSPEDNLPDTQARFVRNYTSIGQLAIGMLHRLLVDGQKGVPRNEQTVVVSSVWKDAIRE